MGDVAVVEKEMVDGPTEGAARPRVEAVDEECEVLGEAGPFGGETWTVTEYVCLRTVGLPAERADPEDVCHGGVGNFLVHPVPSQLP